VKVLFVCAGNAHRSPLAEALLKKLRPDLVADSAGIYMSIPIADEVKRYLAKENAEQYLKKVPESLDSKELDKYDIIVAMDSRHSNAVLSKCPECEAKTIVWNIEDPYFLQPENREKVYMKIKRKVTELAESL
jgi:protein-tyrosine phosphatase